MLVVEDAVGTGSEQTGGECDLFLSTLVLLQRWSDCAGGGHTDVGLRACVRPAALLMALMPCLVLHHKQRSCPCDRSRTAAGHSSG